MCDTLTLDEVVNRMIGLARMQRKVAALAFRDAEKNDESGRMAEVEHIIDCTLFSFISSFVYVSGVDRALTKIDVWGGAMDESKEE